MKFDGRILNILKMADKVGVEKAGVPLIAPTCENTNSLDKKDPEENTAEWILLQKQLLTGLERWLRV